MVEHEKIPEFGTLEHKVMRIKQQLNNITRYGTIVEEKSVIGVILFNIVTFGGANKFIFKDGSTFGWIVKAIFLHWILWLTSWFSIPMKINKIKELISKESELKKELKELQEEIKIRDEREKEFRKELNEALVKIKNWDVKPISKTELDRYGLFSSEKIYFITEAFPVTTHSRIGWVSGSSGINYKLTDKTRIRLGGSKGRLTSSEYRKTGETGYMYLTEKSLRFSGGQSIDCPLNKISRVYINDSGELRILREDRANPIDLAVGQYTEMWVEFITNAIRIFVNR